MKQYQFAVYSFQHGAQSVASQEQLDAMVASGWQINACYPNFVEIAVMWEREVPLPAARKAKSAE